MKETAKAYYLGKKGPRLNCAQSIAEVFREKFSLDEPLMGSLSNCGKGMAPEGYCGAFYSAKCILEKYAPHRIKEGTDQFLASAGSLKCLEIKALKKLFCVGCVEKAVEVVEGATVIESKV